MKRDMELVRALLLEIEAKDKPTMKCLLKENSTKEDLNRLQYHIGMLVDEVGF